MTRCTYHSFANENWVPNLVYVIIVVLLIGLSGGFSIYSLCHPRYTYKRVAGGLHALTAIMLIVLIAQYPTNTNDDLRLNTAEAVAEAAATVSAAAVGGTVQYYYGYSYLLAVITSIISILASLAFFAWSKKRKHSSHDLETQLK